MIQDVMKKVNSRIILMTIAACCLFSSYGIAATSERVTSHPALDYFPSPSQDGRFLAFVSDRTGNPDIWLKSLAAGAVSLPRQLTTHPAVDQDPALNADGSQLLYISHKTDPRGDVYLLDLITGKDIQLTDLQSEDTSPRWAPTGDAFFYLKQDLSSGRRNLYRRTLRQKEETEIATDISSFTINRDGAIAYSQQGNLYLYDPSAPDSRRLFPNNSVLDLWPFFTNHEANQSPSSQFIFFTRYEEDTNKDGIINTEDESSIWLYLWDPSAQKVNAEYRVTPTHQFHLYPTAAQEDLYYSDLKKGDIFRINIKKFFQDYSNFPMAKNLATRYMDTNQVHAGLLVFTNISKNLNSHLPLPERANFDFSYVEYLMEAKKHALAQQVLTPYTELKGKLGALAKIHSVVLDTHQQAENVSTNDLKHLVSNASDTIMTIGKTFQEDDQVYGLALIEAGRLHLLAQDSLTALDYLTQANDLQDNDIRAKALFTRATVYRTLGDESSLLKVFIDVITLLGEESSWGRRAITQAIAVSQQGSTVEEQVASLQRLIADHPQFLMLSVSTRLQMAKLYEEEGEQLKAIRTLDHILTKPPPFQELVERAYRQKAEILSASERYQEAAHTYAALAKFSGENDAELSKVKRLMVLQLVRKAQKDHSIGETRIAAKSFKQILEEHPYTVEAHRGYISTKVMLKEVAAVQGYYTRLVKEQPTNPVYLYSKGLALSYSHPPDIPTIIQLIQQAIHINPSVSYFHQTLGWAYEQQERMSGESRGLEQAEQAYRIALELNDEFQFPDVESYLLLNLGNTYLALSNFREAFHHYQQREKQYSPAGSAVTELLYRKNYGEACFKTGRSEESIEQYRIALKHVPDDKLTLKAELLERIGLSQQDLGHYSEAVESFSQAMEMNLQLGNQKNLALLQRNIGVNLYNLSESENHTDRQALKQALKSYFASLEKIQQFGVKEQETSTGLFNLDVALDEGGSQAAQGFDLDGEEKLMFSYIAGTYEKLSEPGPAREYYLKKLTLISENSAQDNVSHLTEKAVVLNRIGILSYKLGLSTEALLYLRQSLNHTQTLHLRYGTGVNLYNISRLLTDQVLKGAPLDWAILEMLVTSLDAHISSGAKQRSTFYTLTNTAFLLSTLSSHPLRGSPTSKLEDHIADLHTFYRFKTRPWSYYVKAQELLKEASIFPRDDVKPMLVALKLNMLELARGSQKQEIYTKLQEDLLELVEEQHTPNGWIWHLVQAEETNNQLKKKVLLKKALDSLMSFPPQVSISGNTQATLSSLDRLSKLSVDFFVDEKDYDQAFTIAERVNMRKMAIALNKELGETFSLSRIGEYETELQSLFIDLQDTLTQSNPLDIEELLAQVEELYFGLYEEHPSAASYFWQYPLESETLSTVLSPEHAYLKVIAGEKSLHGFLHDGTTVQYIPILSKNGPSHLQQIVDQLPNEVQIAYLSIPEDFFGFGANFSHTETPITRVTSVYDILNSYHQRSLFYTNIAATGQLNLGTSITDGDVPLSTFHLTGEPKQDDPAIQAAHIFIATTGLEGFSFELKKEFHVRETLHLRDMVGYHRHTVMILNPAPHSMDDQKVLISGLIRAGFPHVIINQGTYDQKIAEQFTTLYLTYLADLPPNEAVAAASADLFGEDATRHQFVLYGYAGMDEEQKAQFASTIYTAELDSAVTLYKEGNYQESLPHIENALSVITYADKTNDFHELTQLAVDASFKVGAYDQSVFHQEKLLHSLGEDAPVNERSEVLYRLGILYSRLERFDLAIQHLERAIALWTEAEELDRLAEGIATLGVVRENMGSYSEALKDFSRSFEVYQEIGEIGDVATQYRRIGRIYYLRLGRYEKARENFVAALTTYRELDNQYGEAETLFEIGLTYEKMGLFEEADRHYQQGKQLATALHDPFPLSTAHLYIANTAWFKGQYQTAFQNLSQAEKLAQTAQDPQLTIMVKNTRGLIYWTLNDLDKALTHLKEAVRLAEEADIQTELASSLNNLGLIYRQQQDYVASLEYFEKAKDIDVALNSQWGLGYDYRNIGMSLLKLRKLQEAEVNFIKAEETSAAINNITNWVKALLELGNVNRDLGKSGKAMEYYQKTYELSKDYGIQEVEWRAAEGIARLLRQNTNIQEAFEWYAKAVDIVEGMRASLKIDELRNSFQSNKVDLYRETITLLVELGRPKDAFNYLERSRSRSFIDLLGNQKLTLRNTADETTLAHISDLSLRVGALKTEIGSYETPPETLLEQYRETKARHDEAVLELKQRNPELSSFVSVDPLTQTTVEQLLEPGVGILSYMLTKEKGFVWVLQHTGTTFHEIPVDETTMVDVVTRYRQAVQHLEPVDEELKQLYRLLIQPVRTELTGLNYLGIIPDGPLHFLSFAALQDSESYLVDQFPIFYSPSASVLKFTFAKRRSDKATKVLAVGNPDLGNYNYDLPLAELEAKSIRWNYPNMDILTGRKATKEWFVNNISNYGIIHLAAHGEFDELNPLFSSLWLASEQSDNRRLTVSEVFGLEINADLVTLSACQTGLGKLEAGELIGLNRAFIYAGTHALVSALWRVDDLSTSVMMKHFYRNYVTLDKAKSLRRAQLIVKKDFPHPSYWAGFSLVGDYQ